MSSKARQGCHTLLVYTFQGSIFGKNYEVRDFTKKKLVYLFWNKADSLVVVKSILPQKGTMFIGFNTTVNALFSRIVKA